MRQRTAMLLFAALSSACNRTKHAPAPAPVPAPPGTTRVLASTRTGVERLREPAVAGGFYPRDPGELRAEVETLLGQVTPRNLQHLRALISPHAGYRYSGPVAASGYKQLTGTRFSRVVILAPSHRVPFTGVAIPEVDGFRTPLGVIRLSAEVQNLRGNGFVIDSLPHAKEHSLEVQLPFLQFVLGDFELVPLVFGNTDEAEVAQRLQPLVDERTLFVASSDLSHYYPYEKAKTLDLSTIDAILRLDLAAMAEREACGKSPILTLMHLARARDWKPILLDYRNSGDTSGDRSRVVGYASIAFVDSRGKP